MKGETRTTDESCETAENLTENLTDETIDGGLELTEDAAEVEVESAE